jgi:hypothetical protein
VPGVQGAGVGVGVLPDDARVEDLDQGHAGTSSAAILSGRVTG